MTPAPLTRRSMLAGAAGGVAAVSGCLNEIQNIVGRERHQQLTISIATLPAEQDPYAMQIANELSENLSAVGIEPRINPMDRDVLLREVLVNHDFDIYIAQYPGMNEPDVLKSMLYSPYGEEAGWQNPFGFSSVGIDELLEKQRTVTGENRREVIAELQEEIVREQPFTVLAFPDRIAAIRRDRFTGWPSRGLSSSLSYLELEAVGGAETLELLTTDARVTHNRNPIAVEYRNRGVIMGLLYEPLVRGSGLDVPWLARDLEWSTDGGLSVTAELREASWHDGEAVTAADVAFTYRFLADTSLGEFDTPVPTPWRRGRISLVESVESVGDRRVTIEFSIDVPEIAIRALSVPILPEHIWAERNAAADIAGIDIVGGTTEALVWPNEEPIGSGPFEFADAEADEELTLDRFDEHFLRRDSVGIPDAYAGGPDFDHVRFRVVPSQEAAIELLGNDEADATVGGFRESIVPQIGRNPDLGLSVARSNSFYHVGYNCRRAPLVDSRFRWGIARLLDRAMITSDVFAGYATPTNTPLSDITWVPSELEWDGQGEPPFAGEFGNLDVEAAKSEFRDAGYTYDDGQLVSRGDT